MNANKKFTRHSKGSNIEKIRGPTTRRTSPRGLTPRSKPVRPGASPRSKSTSTPDPLHRITTKNPISKNIGEVYYGKTKYIDIETKEKRRYLVTQQNQNNGNVTVSKLQSIKNFDENGKNADKHLVEINQNYPGLTKRTGVDFFRYKQNRLTKKPLNLTDKKVFNKNPEFRVSNRDLKKAKRHSGVK